MASDLKERAKEAFVDDNFELAVELYTQALDMDPRNADLLADRAQANIKLKSFTEAVADANRAIELDPSMSKAYLRKGTACMSLEEYQTAKAALEAGAALAPGDSRFSKLIKECDEQIAEEASFMSPKVTITLPRTVCLPSRIAAENAKDLVTSMGISSVKQKYRHDYYNTPTEVVLTIFAKGIPSENVHVDFGEQILSVSIDVSSEESYHFQPRLFGKIIPDKCICTVLSSKIEIRLAKADAITWTSLEFSQDKLVPQKINVSSVSQRPAYPSSKSKVDWYKLEAQVKKEEKEEKLEGDAALNKYPSSKSKVDWDKLEAQVKKVEKEEKLEGDAALNKLFSDIYRDADEDTRKAMKKSFMVRGAHSGRGRGLSTSRGSTPTASTPTAGTCHSPSTSIPAARATSAGHSPSTSTPAARATSAGHSPSTSTPAARATSAGHSPSTSTSTPAARATSAGHSPSTSTPVAGAVPTGHSPSTSTPVAGTASTGHDVTPAIPSRHNTPSATPSSGGDSTIARSRCWISGQKIEPSGAVRLSSRLVQAHVPGPVDGFYDFPADLRDELFKMFLTSYQFFRPEDQAAAKITWENTVHRNYQRSLHECRAAQPAKNVHTSGSKSFAAVKDNLTAELEHEPAFRAVFDRTHKRKGRDEYVSDVAHLTAEKYDRQMVEKYGEGTQHPAMDADAWIAAAGPANKGRVYGFGQSLGTSAMTTSTTSTARAPSSSSATFHPPAGSDVSGVKTAVEQVLGRELPRMQMSLEQNITTNMTRLITNLFTQLSGVHGSSSSAVQAQDLPTHSHESDGEDDAPADLA